MWDLSSRLVLRGWQEVSHVHRVLNASVGKFSILLRYELWEHWEKDDTSRLLSHAQKGNGERKSETKR